jgi:hypothetical protein
MNFIGLNNENNNTLNFLDNIKNEYDIDVIIYYRIINSIEEYKLKNIFYFMNLRLKKIDFKIHYENVNNDNINELLKNFIDKDKDKSRVKSIIIMNILQQYIYPLK